MTLPDPNRGLRNGLTLAFWVVLLGLMTWLFSGVLEQLYNPNADLVSQANGNGPREVVLLRDRSGHYRAPGMINGYPVEFLLDTGATDVAVPATLAERIGLKKGFRGQSHTANGLVEHFATRLARISLGPIELRDVRGSILPSMDGRDQVLLGMSFLRRLELIQRGDELTLRQGR